MSNSGDRLVRGIKWAVVALIFLPIIIGVIAFVSWRANLGSEVNGKLQAIKAAGLPTSGEELNKWYRAVPDSANAALVMTQAFALVRNFDDSRSNAIASFKTPSRSEPLSSEDQQLLSAYLKLNEAALAKAGEAAALPQSRYPLDLTCGSYTLLPHLSKIKELARLEEYKALVAARAGNASEAAACVGNILGIAQTLDEEPLLISQLVRIACLSIACRTLECILNSTSLGAKDLQKLADSLATAQEKQPMVRALVGERAMYAPVFRMSWAEIKRMADLGAPESSAGPARPLPGQSPWLVRASGFLERDLNYFLDAIQTNIDFARKTFPESLQVTNVNPKIEQEAIRMKFILSSMVLPAMNRVIVKEAESQAHLRLAFTAVTVERFRLANKRLPSSLEELAPKFLSEVPLDPFTGQPLRYKQLPKGYVIYSLDKDGRDDGGKEKPANRKSTDRSSYDITFTVER
jgi:hypothetical protein